MEVVLLMIWTSLFLVTKVSGVVEVVEFDSPQLFQAGKSMQLKCTSNEQHGLYWSRETPNTNWKEERIEIRQGGLWEERYLIVRPGGYEENILVNNDLQAGDGGTYTCHDDTSQHSFSTFIHVLKVSHQNVTARQGQTATLTCGLSGFTTNPPRIDTMWVLNQRMIGPNYNKDKYNMTTLSDGRFVSLDIFNPGSQDSGAYKCSFILYTQNGYVIFEETIYLNAGALPHSTALQPSSRLLPVFLLSLLTLCLSRHH